VVQVVECLRSTSKALSSVLSVLPKTQTQTQNNINKTTFPPPKPHKFISIDAEKSFDKFNILS
jgi:hypothetical protein